ncbi:MAG: hypothetical protein V8Q84_01930, partial [Bilophila sp.]
KFFSKYAITITYCKIGRKRMERRTFLRGATAMTMAVLTYPHFSLADEQSPVTVYTGGPIFTMNQQNEMAEAIAVQKDIIIGVGTKSDMLALRRKKCSPC